MISDEIVVKGPFGIEKLTTTPPGIEILNNLKKFRNKSHVLINSSDGSTLTFKSLLNDTCRLASSLQNWGLHKNDVALICCQNHINFFTPAISCLYIGSIAAFLNHRFNVGELQHLTKIIKPKIVFCSKMNLSIINELSNQFNCIKKIVVIDSKQSIGNAQSFEDFISENCDINLNIEQFYPVPVDIEEQVAFIFSSSGTTGLPKCVMLTHKNINTKFMHSRDPITSPLSNPTRVSLIPVPCFHAYGGLNTLSNINLGAKTVLMEKFEEVQLLKAINDYQVNVTFAVPPILVLLSKSTLINKYNLSSLQEIIYGGAPLGKDVHDALQKIFPSVAIRQGYGLTELTLAVTFTPVNGFKRGSIGVLVPHMDAKVVDVITNKSLGPNNVGELCFRGPAVMKGYCENPKATNELIKDGWVHTGDIGYYDEDRYFYIVDRLKELIKYKGFQVAPAELEGLVLTHPKVQDVGVIGVPDELCGELPVAFVVKLSNVQITENEILDFIAGLVSAYKKLHRVYFVNEIPKTASGKILRRQLREKFQSLIKYKI